MKNSIVLFYIIALTLWGVSGVSAAPSYGTNMLSQGQFMVGHETYSLFDRDLENSFGEVRSLQHFLLISYGVFDWLTIDLKGGAGYIKQNPQNSGELDYPSAFAGGYGFRVKLYENEALKLRVVGGFHHISVHPRSIMVNGNKHRSILDDWQVDLNFSKDVCGTTPYVGTKWSRVDYIHWLNGSRKRIMSDLTESVGVIAGIDIPLGEKTSLNIEGHFVDEEALSVAILYSF